jgi:hypothetical protein
MNDRQVGKDPEGRSHGIYEIISQQLPGKTKVKQENPQSG